MNEQRIISSTRTLDCKKCKATMREYIFKHVGYQMFLCTNEECEHHMNGVYAENLIKSDDPLYELKMKAREEQRTPEGRENIAIGKVMSDAADSIGEIIGKRIRQMKTLRIKGGEKKPTIGDTITVNGLTFTITHVPENMPDVYMVFYGTI